MTTDMTHNGVGILERLIEPENADLAPELARYFLQFDFKDKDHARMGALLAKAKEGMLTPAEEVEIELYERTGHFLALLQSKARTSLRKAGQSV